MLKYYLAPLEGITGYVYRNAVENVFGQGADKYFAPFIAPVDKRILAPRDARDLLPEHNESFYLVPQIMTTSASDFLQLEKVLMDLGYEELNINLGCPSGTVTSKGRGAGFLKKPEELDQFLEELFAGTRCRISLKTRIGFWEPDEFYELLDIYNKYPLEELIIHPRVREEFYKGTPHKEIFDYAMTHSTNALCYNGDLNCTEDVLSVQNAWEMLPAVMIGRGVIGNPALIRMLRGGDGASRGELEQFLEQLLVGYKSYLSGDTPVLYKMKEVWSYLIRLFPEQNKLYKNLLKSKKLTEYDACVRALLDTL